jgi:hypothetical protein
MRSVLLKPDCSTARVYEPTGSCGIAYSPASLVTAVRMRPVAVCVAVTRAPRTTAPDESVTVPRIVPRTLCAWQGDGRSRVM